MLWQWQLNKLGILWFIDTHFDYAYIIIKNLVDNLKENKFNIYYARFLHLIFKYLLPNVIFYHDYSIHVYVLHKKQFTPMITNDRKKGFSTEPLVYPILFTNLMVQRLVYPHSISTW